jgi:hypothetical protein
MESSLITLVDCITPNGETSQLHTQPSNPISVLDNDNGPANFTVVNGGSAPIQVIPGQRHKSYTDNMWELHKPRIRQLYLQERRTLKEVMHVMREERGFLPS